MTIKYGNGINQGFVIHFQYTREEVDSFLQEYDSDREEYNRLVGLLEDAKANNATLEDRARKEYDEEFASQMADANKEYEAMVKDAMDESILEEEIKSILADKKDETAELEARYLEYIEEARASFEENKKDLLDEAMAFLDEQKEYAKDEAESTRQWFIEENQEDIEDIIEEMNDAEMEMNKSKKRFEDAYSNMIQE